MFCQSPYFVIIYRFIRTFDDWPECECIIAKGLTCRGASYSMTYPTGKDHTAWMNITIPSLMSADPLNWNLTVYLDIITQLSDVSSSQATVVFSSSLLSIRSAGHLPSGGLVTLSLGISPSPVARWEYPCVTDLTCHLSNWFGCHPPPQHLCQDLSLLAHQE